MARPRIRDSETVFTGKVFSVRVDTVERDGKTERIDVVEHTPSFAVIALPEPEKIVLVRQYRHAAMAELWEIPAGMSEAGEAPAAGAARELREETGYSAGRIERVLSAYPSPGFLSELMHIFTAEDLAAGEPSPDEDEELEVQTFTFSEAETLVRTGAIRDMKTILALCWLRSRRHQ